MKYEEKKLTYYSWYEVTVWGEEMLPEELEQLRALENKAAQLKRAKEDL